MRNVTVILPFRQVRHFSFLHLGSESLPVPGCQVRVDEFDKNLNLNRLLFMVHLTRMTQNTESRKHIMCSICYCVCRWRRSRMGPELQPSPVTSSRLRPCGSELRGAGKKRAFNLNSLEPFKFRVVIVSNRFEGGYNPITQMARRKLRLTRKNGL